MSSQTDRTDPLLPSPHPKANRGQFLPLLGQGQQGLVPVLQERGVRTTVAPLYFLAHNPELSLLPSNREMGSLLDPYTHLRHKAWAERPRAFREFSFGNEPEPYDPETARFEDAEILSLAIDPIDAARSRGGTLLQTTYHLAGPIGTRGRSIELLLARLGVEQFRREGMEEPPPFAAVNVRREIYVTIAVRSADLRSPTARNALAEAYLSIPCDGYIVKIEGFHERASVGTVRAGGAFFGALREGGRPLVSSGAGQLHLAMLADEISASIGIAENERFSVPSTWPKKPKDGKRKGRTRMAYLSRFHDSFRVNSEDAKRAFALGGCDCGVHPAGLPPDGAQVAQHSAILRAQQAAEALEGEREERREWLFGSSIMATWALADAQISGARRSPAPKYEALFDGLDARDDLAAPGEQFEL